MNLYIKRVLRKAKMEYACQAEYLQALEEVLLSLSPIFDKHPEYENEHVLEKLIEPNNTIHFDVEYKKDDGTLEKLDGWRIQFNNAVGVYKGGLRFHPSLNESILKGLGFEQIFKNALTTLPIGGAKGGSNFNPKEKSDNEIQRFCYAFMEKLAPYIGEDKDVPAGDIGVGAREINYLYDAYKEIKKNDEKGFITGKPINKGGSLARKEATGYGLVYLLEEIIKNNPIEKPRVIVSGAGNVAIYTAEKCKQLGYQVVAMSDSKGYIIDEDLDLELIKKIKEEKRASLEEYTKGYHQGSVYDTDIKVDIVIPCGTQNEINLDRAKRIVNNGVKIVLEGANLPNDNEAINYYKENKIIFVPGKASNAGGVATSFLEMEQNRLNEKWSFDKVDNKLKQIMKDIHKQCIDTMEEYSIPKYDYAKAANIAAANRVIKEMIK